MVREAGVEPARPEWTLEPELKKERFSLYRKVDSDAVKSLVKSRFSGHQGPKLQTPLLMQKISSLLDVCWIFSSAHLHRKRIIRFENVTWKGDFYVHRFFRTCK